MSRFATSMALLIVVAACACSSAGKGNASSGETAAADAPGPTARVPANSRPDTLPQSEPSRLEAPLIMPAARDTASGDGATIARFEREARAVARTAGCASARQCRTAPVGARACGGPRTYIVYCAATTDTLALMRKLRELERAEKAYNARTGLMSTCEMRLAPAVALIGGSCREATGAP